MNILVIGSGGREHALVWKLRQSAAVTKIWCAPGNGGISRDAECMPLDVKDARAAADMATKVGADLTVVGTETPLVLGIADEFERRGPALLGPTQQAAQLEGSKVFAKRFMERHRIPTASVYGICESVWEARETLGKVVWPLVIKADGLCAGKGVVVAQSADEAVAFVTRLMEQNEFGDAGRRAVLEEGLSGDELSYIVLTDGEGFVPLAPTRDHKRAFDGDRGPNTGGMGAYSSDVMLTMELERRIVENIVQPTLAGLREEGITYRGFLYFGLMLTADGPKVLEFNCRLGDPEAQAIMLRADFDFAEACWEAARGSVASIKARWKPGASVCVVMTSEGYPGNPVTGRAIAGLDEAAAVSGAVIFHAGTRREGDKYLTAGGRVLGVGARGDSLEEACRTAYDAVARISFEGAHYRKDIGRPRNAKGHAAGDKNG